VTSLGADRVIDYTRQDFTEDQGHYDVIIDNVGNRSLRECRRALQPTGIYIMIGGQPGPWIAPMDRALGAWITSMFVKQKMGMMLAHTKTADLATLARLLQNGKLKAVIDRTYKLTEAPEAIRYLEQGHARGKVVIAIE
jgi:NADPH:quinone reductase-like Zn-dependent oxidoreductase